MQCPHCRLENPPSAVICDCGYNFDNKDSSRASPEKAKRRTPLFKARRFAIAGLLLGIFGAIISYIAFEPALFALSLVPAGPSLWFLIRPSRVAFRVLGCGIVIFAAEILVHAMPSNSLYVNVVVMVAGGVYAFIYSWKLPKTQQSKGIGAR